MTAVAFGKPPQLPPAMLALIFVTIALLLRNLACLERCLNVAR